MTTSMTIVNQFGGMKTAAMIGATYALGKSDVTVKFKAGNAKTGNTVVIKLDEWDTYTMTFWYCRGINARELTSVSMVYGDQLRKVFESHTGLATSL